MVPQPQQLDTKLRTWCLNAPTQYGIEKVRSVSVEMSSECWGNSIMENGSHQLFLEPAMWFCYEMWFANTAEWSRLNIKLKEQDVQLVYLSLYIIYKVYSGALNLYELHYQVK